MPGTSRACSGRVQALEMIREDECVEVTPKSIRLRKVELSQTKRQSMSSRRKRDAQSVPA